MYDYVIIDKELLPLTKEEKDKIPQDIQWQSKSFDCIMTEVYFTKELTLQINRFEYETVPKEERPYPDAKGLLEFYGSMRRVNEHLEDLPFHGYVEFYAQIEEEWFEFKAKFTDDKLVEIKRIYND